MFSHTSCNNTLPDFAEPYLDAKGLPLKIRKGQSGGKRMLLLTVTWLVNEKCRRQYGLQVMKSNLSSVNLCNTQKNLCFTNGL